MTLSPVYTRIPPCDPDLVRRAGTFSVADLHEAMGSILGLKAITAPTMRAIVSGTTAAGQAITVENYPGDNVLLYAALDLIQPGQMLVMSNGGGWHGAQLGDVSSTFLQTRGAAGAVVDGPVRDVDALREIRFPVWATSISVSHPEKRGPGSVNCPISVAGARVCPGDVVVADGDGAIVIPPALLSGVLNAAQARAERETVYREKLLKGEPIVDVVGVRELLEGQITRRDMLWSEDEAAS